MNGLDQLLFLWLNAPPDAAPALVAAARLLAVQTPYLLGLAFAAACLRGAPLRRGLLPVLAAFALAMLVAWGIRQAWPQPRPFALNLGLQLLAHSPSAGFPSSHATGCFAIAAAMLLQPRLRAAGWLLLAVALALGWSRVYLGVHFPFDILGAAAVGSGAAIIVRISCGRPETKGLAGSVAEPLPHEITAG